jgi:hypothetical protein
MEQCLAQLSALKAATPQTRPHCIDHDDADFIVDDESAPEEDHQVCQDTVPSTHCAAVHDHNAEEFVDFWPGTRELLHERGLWLNDTTPSGECQFEAFAAAYAFDPSLQAQFRIAACDYIIAHPLDFLQYHIGSFDNFKLHYDVDMREEHCWGDQLTLMALAEVYSCTINVLTHHHATNTLLTSQHIPQRSKPLREVTIVHNGQEEQGHYAWVSTEQPQLEPMLQHPHPMVDANCDEHTLMFADIDNDDANDKFFETAPEGQ